MASRWYVIRTKPRKEDFLAEQMETRNMEVFHPRIRVQTVNPRSKKIKPYFPGYIFAHLDLPRVGSSIQYIPGAVNLVSFGGEAADVPEALVHAIQHRVDEINTAGGELFEALTTGQPVMVHSGPFGGYEGIFDMRLPGNDRVRILLKLLKDRQIPVELSAGLIHPIKKPR